MDATTAQPTLLSAARNFIRKSAGTAVLTIAPLAALTAVNEAKGQVVLSVPTAGQFSGLSFSGAGRTPGYSGFFSEQLPPLANITGIRQGVNAIFLFSSGAGPSGGGAAAVFFAASTFTGTINSGTNIPISYDFTFGGTGTATVTSWNLFFNLSDGGGSGADQLIASGSGLGNFSGTSFTYFADPPTNPDFTNGYTYLYMTFMYGGANGFNNDSLSLSMNSSTQGISINAIPEPATYAGLFGLGALGLVLVRRWRRTIIA